MENTKIEIVNDKSKGDKFKALCAICNADVNHIVTQSTDRDITEEYFSEGEEEAQGYIWSIDNFQIVQCLGCDNFSFRHKSWFSEAEHFHSDDDQDDGTITRLYPKRSKDILTIKDFPNVPNNLRIIYKEVVNCFNNDSSIMCAAGLRATIEGLCAAQNVTDGPVEYKKSDGTKEIKRRDNLEGKISGLYEKGVLTKDRADTLHEHRYMGNIAVHELSRPSIETLELAISIIEHTFESVYEIPEKAAALRANRAKRSVL